MENKALRPTFLGPGPLQPSLLGKLTRLGNGVGASHRPEAIHVDDSRPGDDPNRSHGEEVPQASSLKVLHNDCAPCFGHLLKEPHALGLGEVVEKEGRRDQIKTSREFFGRGVMLEEIHPESLPSGPIPGEVQGHWTPVAGCNLKIHPRTPSQTLQSQGNVTPPARYIQDPQRPCGGRGEIPEPVPDPPNGQGEDIDPAQGPEGAVMSSHIQPRSIHQFRLSVSDGQVGEDQWHSRSLSLWGR